MGIITNPVSGSLVGTNITVTVGGAGDYATIGAALEYLSRLYPKYVSGGVRATINLLAGFTMAEQVLIDGLDLSWITLTGADAQTTVTRSALTTDFTTSEYGFALYPAIGVKRGKLFLIDQLFEMDTSGTSTNRTGVVIIDGSHGGFTPGAGMKNTPVHGAYAGIGSTMSAGSGVFTGNLYGIQLTRGAVAQINSANVSGCSGNGLRLSSCTAFAEAVNANSCGIGINAGAGTMIFATSATANSCTDTGFLVATAHAAFTNGSATGCTNYGLDCQDGGLAYAGGCNFSSAGTYGIRVLRASTVGAESATATLSQTKNTVTSNGIIYQT